MFAAAGKRPPRHLILPDPFGLANTHITDFDVFRSCGALRNANAIPDRPSVRRIRPTKERSADWPRVYAILAPTGAS